MKPERVSIIVAFKDPLVGVAISKPHIDPSRKAQRVRDLFQRDAQAKAMTQHFQSSRIHQRQIKRKEMRIAPVCRRAINQI